MGEAFDPVAHVRKGWLWWECEGCAHRHGVPVEGAQAWGWNGSTEAPTLKESVMCNRGMPSQCHSQITDGQVSWYGDCTHALAGTVRPLPHFVW